MQHAHDVEAHVEADEIRQRQRAHGMRHAQPEDLVHRFGVATPSITAYMASLSSGISTRFETKPGASFTSTGVFPSFSAEPHRLVGLLRGRQPADHLDQLHHRHRIEEVHPDDVVGARVTAASLVMEIDDVFDARITSGRQQSSSREKFRLISNRSVAASTMKSHVGQPRAVQRR